MNLYCSMYRHSIGATLGKVSPKIHNTTQRHFSAKSNPFPPRTKIVCTMGPASENKIDHLIQAGMDVARLNFSHSTIDYHAKIFNTIRDIASKNEHQVSVLCDIQGPKIRVGKVKEPFTANVGSTIRVTTDKIEGTPERISIDYPPLLNEIKVGGKIFINDGIVQLNVIGKTTTELICKVETAGIISNNKGCNIPNCNISLDVITEKDEKDIEFIAKLDPEYLAASFIGTANDVIRVRKCLEKFGNTRIKIISKIERAIALENLDAIINVSNGLMVARGDLGVEIPAYEVPAVQKEIVRKCNKQGLPVIIATQMLESMVLQSRPTRAEANDVYNAVLDGADAVMLSGETSAGKYPVEAVKIMDDIVRRAEKSIPIRFLNDYDSKVKSNMMVESIGHICFDLVREIREYGNKPKIIIITASGYTARMISKYRPDAPMIALTPRLNVLRELNLIWGVRAFHCPEEIINCKNLEERAVHSISAMVNKGWVDQDEHVIVVSSSIISPEHGMSLEIYDVNKLLNK